MTGIVLALCNKTDTMLRDWRDAGYECWAVDIQHKGDRVIDGIRYIEADVCNWLPPPNLYAVFAFGPCTHLAVSGARWFKEKGLYALAEGTKIAARCVAICEWSGAPWLFENPVGVLSSHWRKPDYIFQPWNFGDLESKKTCLWTGGGFVMPEFEFVTKPDGVKESIWKCPPGPERSNIRSATFPGFARAVFEANHERTATC